MVKYNDTHRNGVSGNLPMAGAGLKPLCKGLAALLLNFVKIGLFQIATPYIREREVFSL